MKSLDVSTETKASLQIEFRGTNHIILLLLPFSLSTDSIMAERKKVYKNLWEAKIGLWHKIVYTVKSFKTQT